MKKKISNRKYFVYVSEKNDDGETEHVGLRFLTERELKRELARLRVRGGKEENKY
jgi:hypothetical protein